MSGLELMEQVVADEREVEEDATSSDGSVSSTASSRLALEHLRELSPNELRDRDVVRLAENRVQGFLPHQLERKLGDCERAVRIRRALLERASKIDAVRDLPFEGFEYDAVLGACCENVVGHVVIPVGYAGPLLLDGVPVHVPLATLEGALVASAHRGPFLAHAVLRVCRY